MALPGCCSRRACRRLTTARGLLRHPQRVAGFNRNGWLVCVGISGWNGSELPAALRRIPQPYPWSPRDIEIIDARTAETMPWRNRSPRSKGPRRPAPAKGFMLGYGRVSREGQDLAQQRAVLRVAGCGRLFEEKASGGRWDRPELHRLLDHLRPGDVVVVWKLDRLSRSLKDLLHIMEKIAEAGAGFRSLTECIDTTTPAGRMMMQMVGAFAEFERAMIRERTSAGLAAARAEGRIGGRRKKLDETKRRRSPRRLSQVGRPRHRWRGCSVCRHRLCPVSSPLMWLVHDPNAAATPGCVWSLCPGSRSYPLSLRSGHE